MRRNKAEMMAIAGRIAIGAVFAVSGIAKIEDPSAFVAAILGYHLPLPVAWINPIAVVLPWFELVVGALLLGGIWVDAGLTAAFVLFAFFLGINLQALARGLPVDCGCFGRLDDASPQFLKSVPFVLGRDLALVAISGLLGWRWLRRPSLPQK